MRISLLTHYYAPEVGAPQTRLRETAELLRSGGHTVSVITTMPHYPGGRILEGYRAFSVRREQIDGVAVLRLPVVARPNRGLLDRVVDQGSFATAALAAAPVVRRSEAMIVESPPLFLGATARVLRSLTSVPYLLHVSDPWPDYPIALGALRGRTAIRAARFLETVAYSGAAAITTVTPSLVDLLDRNPAASGRVRLLPNTVNTSRFDPSITPAVARARLGWDPDRFTIVYCGTLGLAQGVGTLVDAVAGIDDPRLHLRIVGDGIEAGDLRRRIDSLRSPRIKLERPVAADMVPTVLAAADAVAVVLRSGAMLEAALPTKLVEALAAGRPILVSASGDTARIVEEAGAGVVAPAEDVPSLRAAIVELMRGSHRSTMAEAGRALAVARFERATVARELAKILETIR